MSPRPRTLWSLSVVLAPEGAEAVAEFLLRLTGQPAVITHSRVTGRTTASVYLEDAAFWNPARRRELKAGLKAIEDCGLQLRPVRIRWAAVPPEDWSKSWKRHFPPLVVGKVLLVRPSWSRLRPGPGQVEIILDPGLSFGTGQHPTTEFCLREVVRLRPRSAEASLLDVGTGSGVLAIAAARLGYSPVKAMELDPEAVAVARRNALANAVDARITIVRGDVARLSNPLRRGYSVVCANLTADLLRQHAARLWNQVAPGGHLVLAGILAEEFDQVSRHYEGLGASRVRHQRRREWQSGSFLRPG